MRRRLSMKPGITGLWQVSGRSNLSFEQWMEMDLQYLDNWSNAEDLRLLALTFPAVVAGRGAK
jgi:lipopolysaccharide/colanic/teichoic acid biosynthesis glycosyltransferase